MRQPFADRKEREPQAENKEGQAGDNQQSADQDRAEIVDRLANDDQLEYADDDDDRQQVTQAVSGIPGECV